MHSEESGLRSVLLRGGNVMRCLPTAWQEQTAKPSRKSVGKGDLVLTTSFQVSAAYNSHNVSEIWANPDGFIHFILLGRPFL